jgi:type I restriction enzyme, S subunit
MSKQWPQVRLGDVIRQEREQVGTFDGSNLPVLGVTNVEGVTQTGVEASDDKSKYLRLRPGRFVYNPYRINVGSIGLSAQSQDGICSPAYVIFAPTERIDAQFLWFFLKSARGNQLINFHGNRGSVRSALRYEDLCEISVALPSMIEQRQIVARVEELAGQIREARNLRNSAAEGAQALTSSAQSALLRLETADRMSIEELVGADGLRNGKSVKSAGAESAIRCLTLSAMRDGRIDVRDSKPVPMSSTEAAPYLVRKGDVYVIRGNGSKHLCGRAGCVADDSMGVVFPDLFIQVALPKDRVLPQFFVSAWNCSDTRTVIEEKAKTTSGIWKINQGHILSTSIPVPPLAEQHQIVAELAALQSEADALKRLQDETAADLDALLPAVLHLAFRGELL